MFLAVMISRLELPVCGEILGKEKNVEDWWSKISFDSKIRYRNCVQHPLQHKEKWFAFWLTEKKIV